MKIKHFAGILLLSIGLASCGPGYVRQPVVVQQAPVAVAQPAVVEQPVYDDMTGNYQVYTDPSGAQYAVTMIDGVQRYIAYNTFMSYINSGGYPALYNYYYSNPSYFSVWNSGLGWRSYGSPVSYASYYNSHHISRAAYSNYRRSRATISSANTGVNRTSSMGYGRRTTTTTTTTVPASQSSSMGYGRRSQPATTTSTRTVSLSRPSAGTSNFPAAPRSYSPSVNRSSSFSIRSSSSSSRSSSGSSSGFGRRSR